MNLNEPYKLRIKTLVCEFVECVEAYISKYSKVLAGEEMNNYSSSRMSQAVTAGSSTVGFAGIGHTFNLIMRERKNNVNRIKASEREKFVKFYENNTNECRGYLIDAALDIFQSFENQFMNVVSKNNTITDVMALLAKTAARKLKNHINNFDEGDFDFKKLSKYVLEAGLEGSLEFLNKVEIGQFNSIKKNKYSNESWNVKSLFEKVGIVIIKNNQYYFYQNNTSKTKYGFRRLLLCEDEKEALKDYQIVKMSKNFEGYNYIITAEMIKQFSSHFREEFDNKEQINRKMLLEITKKEPKLARTASFKKVEPFMYNYQYPVNHFIERGTMLDLINEALTHEANRVQIATTVIISGLGGIGKSELARKYADVYTSDKKFYRNVIWITADAAEKVEESYKILLKDKFNMNDLDHIETEKVISLLYKNLEKCGNNLIIFDNVEDPQHIETFLHRRSQENKIKFLVTSRNRKWPDNKLGTLKVFEIDVFSETEAFDFVSKSLNIENQHEEVKELTEFLEYFPLALSQAVSNIIEQQKKSIKWGKQTHYLIKDYISLSKEKSKRHALKQNSSVDERYRNTTFTTWLTTLETLKKYDCGSIAIEKLNEFAFMAPQKIKVECIYEMSEEIEEAIELLDTYSMIKLEKGIVSMHSLVQDVVRYEFKKQEKKVVERLLENFHRNVECNLDHFKIVWKYGTKYNDLIKKYFSKLEEVIDEMVKKGRYAKAISFAKMIIEKVKQTFDHEDPNLLNIQRSYGTALLKQLRFIESFTVLQDVLKIQKRKLGGFHPATLITMFEYACCMDEMGAHSTALKYFQDILVPIDVVKNLYDYPKIFDCNVKDRIGEALSRRYDYFNARVFLEQSLLEKKNIFGSEHPYYAYTKNLLDITIKQYSGASINEAEITSQLQNYDQPKRFQILEKIAKQLYRSGKKKDGLKMYEDMYIKCCKIYKENDPITQRYKNIISSLSPTFDDTNIILQGQHDIDILMKDHIKRDHKHSNIIQRFEYECDTDKNFYLPFNDLLNLLDKLGGNFSIDVVRDIAMTYLRQQDIVLFEGFNKKSSNLECHKAVSKNYTEKLNHILTTNPSLIDEKDLHGNTPLMWACIKGDAKMVKILIENGADLKLKNFNDYTALHWAVRRENEEIIKLLLKADQTLTEDHTVKSHTVLHEAVKNYKILEILLKNSKLNPNAADGSRNTPLMWASFLGQIESMKLLVEYKADIGLKNSQNQTALHWAILNKESLKWLHEHRSNFHATNGNDNDRTLIHEASMYRNLNILKNILEVIGSNDINARTENGYTPILIACKFGNLEVAKHLYKLGADINLKCKNNTTPSIWAAKNGHSVVLTWLLKNGADLSTVTKPGWKILHAAASSKNLRTLEIVLDSMEKNIKSEINKKTCKGGTPIYFTFKTNCDELAIPLFECGADINLANNKGLTPLFWAAINGNFEGTKWLLKNGADINAVDCYGCNILQAACWGGNLDCLKLIVEKIKIKDKSIFNVQTKFGQTPLIFACEGNKFEIAEYLIELGIEVNSKNESGWTPLHSAAMNEKPEAFKWLLEKGADISATSDHGYTVLHEIAWGGGIDCLELYKNSAGSNISRIINAQTKFGETPLYISCRKNNQEIAEQLILNFGADVNMKDKYGRTPLYWAIKNKNIHIINTLINHKADATVLNYRKDTLLNISISTGYIKILETVLDVMKTQKFDALNMLNDDGNLPFQYACYYGNIDAAKLLLKLGSDMHHLNSHGKNALYWAARLGHEDTVNWLIENGANVCNIGNDGTTILHAAVLSGNKEVIKSVVNALKLTDNTIINHQDMNGTTALMIATKQHNFQAIELLTNNEKSIQNNRLENGEFCVNRRKFVQKVLRIG